MPSLDALAEKYEWPTFYPKRPESCYAHHETHECEFSKMQPLDAEQEAELIIRGRRAITPRLALDLEREIGINATTLVRVQADYDLAVERARREEA